MRAFGCGAAVLAFAAASTVGCHLPNNERSGDMMQQSQKIDGLVMRLASSNHSVDAVAQVLGDRFSETNGEYRVQIGKGPFESAAVSRFQNKINIYFTLSTGSWRLGDITDNVREWQVTPRLPDSGQLVRVRDWHWSQLTIRCLADMAAMEGSPPDNEDMVKRLSCHIYPL